VNLSLEVIGIAGFLTNVGGNILIGRKSEHGYPVRLLSNALWVAYAWSAMSPSVVLNAVTFSALNVWYWRAWRRERKAHVS
jgi:hypothetical protein